MQPFCTSCSIVSDKTECFTAGSFREFMRIVEIILSTFLGYAQMANGRTDRLVGTVKRANAKVVFNGDKNWVQAEPCIINENCCLRLVKGSPPFELMHSVFQQIKRGKGGRGENAIRTLQSGKYDASSNGAAESPFK